MGKLMAVILNSKKKKDSLVLFIMSLLMVNSIGQLNKRAMLTGKRFWYLLVWNQLDNQIRGTASLENLKIYQGCQKKLSAWENCYYLVGFGGLLCFN